MHVNALSEGSSTVETVPSRPPELKDWIRIISTVLQSCLKFYQTPVRLDFGFPTAAHEELTFYLRKPSSFTAAEGAAGPASENTSTNRLPALVGAAPTGAAERIPSRSADGDGVDWKTKQNEDVGCLFTAAGLQ